MLHNLIGFREKFPTPDVNAKHYYPLTPGRFYLGKK